MPLTPGEHGRQWPSGFYREIAWLEVDDEWLSKAFGHDLVSGDEPGLGPWVGAGAILPSGEMVEAVRYALAQRSFGFSLRIDEKASASVLDEFVRESGIADSAVIKAPTATHP